MVTQFPEPPVEASGRTGGTDRGWHITFGLLLTVTFAAFTMWSFGWEPDSTNRVLLFTAIVFGLFMAFNIGGNDVANSFGTSVGAGTLTMKQALLVACVFEISGAVLAGGEVTDTVRSGIVDLDVVGDSPMEFVFIMMAALLGAAVWLLIATRMGWPVSTTHSIIGGIVGAAVTMGFVTGTGGWEMVQWSEIGRIAISWVLSPLLGGAASFLLYGAIKRHVLVYNERADEAVRAIKRERTEHRRRHKARFERLGEIQQIAYNNAMAQDAAVFREPDYDPTELETDYYRELAEIDERASHLNTHRALETWVPALAAMGAVVIAWMMLFRSLHLSVDSLGGALTLGMIGVAVWMGVHILTKTLRKQALPKATFLVFAWMQVFTASAFAFSHGSNDLANAVGPFAAVLDTLKSNTVEAEAAVPVAVMVAFGVAMLSGLWFIGRTVIRTVGTNLTEIHPASGFAAELSAAAVVMLASGLGLPVSSTHILIGAVLGVGIVNRAANWKLMRPIGLAWVITLPAAAGVGALGYLGLSAAF